MKLIIAGGRRTRLTREDWKKLDSIPGVTEVVSGCAPGVDTDGERWACARQIPIRRFRALWRKYGKVAGFIRNGEMADYADAAAIFDGNKGTADMFNKAVKKGLVIYDFRTKGQGILGFAKPDQTVSGDV